MKHLYGLIILFIAANASLQAQNKHALIVAIGAYKPETNWGPLGSANDVPYIKSSLEKQSFPAANIVVIQDEAATKKGIENAFAELLKKVKANDIVVIHFSSHGVQIMDDDGDETDGKDEAIVPYDAVLPTDYSQWDKYVDGYLRDDDFGEYIESLRTKLGSKGNVIVILDACNSGTATRGTKPIRGGKPALVPPDFKPSKNAKKPTTGEFMEIGAPSESKASYIVFSAARAEEKNSEIELPATEKNMGSLTYAITKALDNLQPGTTYRSLFADVLTTMNDKVSGQNPVLEGDKLDQGLFAGKMVYQKPYVEVNTFDESDGKTITLKGGKIQGLDVGTKVALHKSGTNDPTATTLLSKGIVTASESFTSTVVLETADVIKLPAQGWIFITEPIFKSDPLQIEIVKSQPGGGFSDEKVTEMETVLKAMPAVQLSGNPELLIIHGSEKDSIIIASNGLLFGTFKNTAVLQDQLKHYMQYKFLKNLEIVDPDFDLEVRLLPVINGKIDSSLNNPKMVGGILEFEEGDTMVVYVKNKTNRGLYVNILDLQPDGLINPVFPNDKPRIEKTELFIEAGKEITFDKWALEIAKPYGMETYKIFVSRQELDMKSIALNNGARTRGDISVLQELVSESYTATSRGSRIIKTAEPDGAVFSIVYRIKEKQ